MDYQAELDKVEKKLRDIELALNESSIVAITDRHGVITFANDQFCQVSKYSREELVGSNQRIVNSGHHSREFFKEMWRTIGTGNVWKGEIKNKAKDGSIYWVDTTIVPFVNDNGKPYQYIAIRHNITKRKQYEENIAHLAYYDPLTALPNRNLLSEWIKEQAGNDHKNVAVLFLDIDRFKSINDNYGHHVGDFLLREVAIRLKNSLRHSDFISRQGGDEFIIFLNEVSSKQTISEIVNKIITQIRLPYHIQNQRITTNVSIGISIGSLRDQQDDYTKDIETLIKQADTALYHAKAKGGNTYCFNTANQNMKVNRYYQIEQELRKPILYEQLSVVYQPLINLKNNKIVGAEALLRWHHPQLGNVTPIEFIPLLEELGLIIPVGKWVLRSVCNQMKQWQDTGVFLERVSVNVSPLQFQNSDFLLDVKQVLAETAMDPHLLEIEITENALLNINESLNTLLALKELGIHISIDDFGTGYSSLSYLKELPIDTLKIDKSFIQSLNIDGEILVNTIINMGKNLNHTVLAEGIETKDQMAYLKNQHCHEGQGYYWSKPVNSEEIVKLKMLEDGSTFEKDAHY
ncbi:EAL domain-containing protein [Lentibacillus cibarius]|uniref:EAL domain-containing protein n=1 Tax=Lentibacillus cibarius TaxID=2583219 RepID=A0A549YII5_9BACI|nr:EAL domain-containing protein [Lentibacillus cibarius]TRM11689.1 EAL domain-containing protein [Lentibacillus cibarius]